MTNDDIHNKLCENPDFAKRFNLLTTGIFIKGDWSKDQGRLIPYTDTRPDLDSIMMYSSAAFAEDVGACHRDLNYCTLTKKLFNENGEWAAEEYIRRPAQPSLGDANRIRALYPWKG
jgi:hypothetical protein